MGLDGRGALCQAEVFDSISISNGEALNMFGQESNLVESKKWKAKIGKAMRF